MMTNLILAQAAAGPSGHETWLVLGGVAVVASILGNYAQWVMSRRTQENVRISNQPLSVGGDMDVRVKGKRFSSDMCEAKHQALDETLRSLAEEDHRLRVDLETIRNGLGDMERRINSADEDRSSALHNRLNEILEKVGELRGRVK